MGLFWGNGEKKAAQPQAPADPRTEPLTLGFVLDSGGYIRSDEEFTYIIRDMHLMIKQLLRENQMLHQRLNKLEAEFQANTQVTRAL